MIQANELRIGNWVYHIELCENVQIESISSDQVTIKDHVVWDGDIGLIVGIPLTEEILLKCGFDENDYYFSIGDFILRKPDFVVCDMEIRVQPKYLHQLQNLYFALTNTEIKINLHSK